jgi:hypothetical protein
MEIIIAIADTDLVISPADEKCSLVRAGTDSQRIVFGDGFVAEQGLAAV